MAKTQLDNIKAHLKSGRSLSPLEALGLYGAFRLAARIKELRDLGYTINTENRMDPNGKQYAVYTMPPVINTDLPAFISEGRV